MALRQFKIFVDVCETLNMTATAEKLFMSQSAVSQAVAELEKHYNVKLFERLSRKLYITQAGKKLLSYAQHMIQMNTEVEEAMKTLDENGPIRIGASVTIGSYVLPKLVSQFKEISPKINVKVFEDNTAAIESSIISDKIDIGLVEGKIASPDIVSRPFMDDKLVLICGAKHRFSKLSIIEPHELERENFIIRESGSGTRETFENSMTANSLAWNVVWTCNNADTIKMAVSEGLGVSVISQLAVKNEVKSGVLFQLSVDGIDFKRQFKIIIHKNKYLTRSMHSFIKFCL